MQHRNDYSGSDNAYWQQQGDTYPCPNPYQPWQGAPYDPQYYLHLEAVKWQNSQVPLHYPYPPPPPGSILPGLHSLAHPQYPSPAPPLPARGTEFSASQGAWRPHVQTEPPTWPASASLSGFQPELFQQEHSNQVEAAAASQDIAEFQGVEGVDEQASGEVSESVEKKRGDNKDAQAQKAGTAEGESAMTAVYCKACQTWLNGPRQWNDHRIGKKHRKNEAKQRREGSGSLDASCSKNLAQNKEPVRPPELDLWTKGENETADWLNSAAEELLITRARGGDWGSLDTIPEKSEEDTSGGGGRSRTRKSRRERKQNAD